MLDNINTGQMNYKKIIFPAASRNVLKINIGTRRSVLSYSLLIRYSFYLSSRSKKKIRRVTQLLSLTRAIQKWKENVYNWDKESNRGREKTMTRKISLVIREPAFISNETSADSFRRERHCPFAILFIQGVLQNFKFPFY